MIIFYGYPKRTVARPKIGRPIQEQSPSIRSSFVEASPTRVFRDGEGTFSPNDILALMPDVLPRLALLDLIFDQRERSVYEVHEFSVGSGDEQGSNERQV